jgi:ankyrin repeat protein
MEDLLEAALDGDLATIKRLQAEGVDVTHAHVRSGVTAIMVGAWYGHSTMVKFLCTAGASVVEKNDHGCSALHFAADSNKISLIQYFLQEAGASISDATNDGSTIWTLLKPQNHDPVALASLLKIMVMLDDAPPAFVAKLSAAHYGLNTRGRHYRAQLPSYLEQQQDMVIEHCPLPAVLQSIVCEYSATTPEDMWAYGLRI